MIFVQGHVLAALQCMSTYLLDSGCNSQGTVNRSTAIPHLSDYHLFGVFKVAVSGIHFCADEEVLCGEKFIV
jgi:hypothetical protein